MGTRPGTREFAIIVSPDYRLLPTASGIVDIVDDLEDFWQWSRFKLPAILDRNAPGQSLGFARLLITGASAGGYCAVQLALSHPDEVSAVAVAYPALDLRDDIFVNGPGPGEPTVLRFSPETIPARDDTITRIEEKRKTIATKGGWERTPYCVGSCQHGLFASNVLDNKCHNAPEIFPLDRVETGAKLPKNVWIMHGDDDSVVHIRATHKFAELVAMWPETVLRVDVADGEDHAFDFESRRWESFAAAALDFTSRVWLRNYNVAPSFEGRREASNRRVGGFDFK